MSHFTVLVIGENPEEQLAPFDENIEVEPYLSDGEITTYNPKSKWDWYSLGGRWAGFFTVKRDAEIAIQGHHRAKDFAKITGEIVEDIPVCKVDQCLKKDIDIDRMRLEERADAIKDYAKFIAALDGEPMPPIWSKFRESFSDIDQARAVYHSIKSVENLKKTDFWGEDFLTTEDEYVEKRVKNVITTFAVLKDGVWYERGKMGWWACVSDEKDNWNEEFNKLFDSIPGETLLSVYDCHI